MDAKDKEKSLDICIQGTGFQRNEKIEETCHIPRSTQSELVQLPTFIWLIFMVNAGKYTID